MIRNATKNDIEGILEIEKASFKWFDGFSKSVFYQYLNEFRDGFFVVLGKSGSIVGYAILADKKGNGYLLSIAVHPKSRNKGIAASLLKYLESKCRKKGFPKLMLEVREDNKRAIDVYKKQGLVEVAKKKDFYGDRVDALVMEKTVSD